MNLTVDQLRRLADTPRSRFKAEFPGYSQKFLREQKREAKRRFKPTQDILREYAELARDLGRSPTNKELTSTVATRNTIVYRFESIENLDALAREKYPKHFGDHRVESLLVDAVPTADVHVITTAVDSMTTDTALLSALRSLAQDRAGKLTLMYCKDPAHTSWAKRRGHHVVDKALADEAFVGTDVPLNSNLLLSGIQVTAKQINPLTSIKRLLNRKRASLIVASPKQHLAFAATRDKHPRAGICTGTVSNSEYLSDNPWAKRMAYLADMDHTKGAIIVENLRGDQDGLFFFRQVQAAADGSIIDLNKRYLPNGKIETVRPETLVFGDIHVERESEQHTALRMRMVRDLRPKRVFLHDLLDFFVSSHHNIGRYITQARLPHTNLQQHLDAAVAEIEWLTEEGVEVFVVRSNHDRHLDQYLDGMRYRNEPHNFDLAHRLALAKLDGWNPLEYYMRDLQGATFLDGRESLRVEGIEHAEHGDIGANGSRGSLSSLESSYGAINCGHSHTAGILRDAWQAGKSCDDDLGYNQGASSWTTSHILTYPGGLRQMITCIGDRYHAGDQP